MADYKFKRQIAYELFMSTEKSQQEIAELVKVSEATLINWKQAGDWGKVRDEQRALGLQSVTLLVNLFKRAKEESEKVGTDFNPDRFNKIVASIDRLRGKYAKMDALTQVAKEFISYLMEIGKQDEATLFTSLFDEYIQKRSMRQ